MAYAAEGLAEEQLLGLSSLAADSVSNGGPSVSIPPDSAGLPSVLAALGCAESVTAAELLRTHITGGAKAVDARLKAAGIKSMGQRLKVQNALQQGADCDRIVMSLLHAKLAEAPDIQLPLSQPPAPEPVAAQELVAVVPPSAAPSTAVPPEEPPPPLPPPPASAPHSAAEPQQWRVVFFPQVFVRNRPSVTAAKVSALPTGAPIHVAYIDSQGWARLEGAEERWVLTHGASIGLQMPLIQLYSQSDQLAIQDSLARLSSGRELSVRGRTIEALEALEAGLISIDAVDPTLKELEVRSPSLLLSPSAEAALALCLRVCVPCRAWTSRLPPVSCGWSSDGSPLLASQETALCLEKCATLAHAIKLDRARHDNGRNGGRNGGLGGGLGGGHGGGSAASATLDGAAPSVATAEALLSLLRSRGLEATALAALDKKALSAALSEAGFKTGPRLKLEAALSRRAAPSAAAAAGAAGESADLYHNECFGAMSAPLTSAAQFGYAWDLFIVAATSLSDHRSRTNRRHYQICAYMAMSGVALGMYDNVIILAQEALAAPKPLADVLVGLVQVAKTVQEEVRTSAEALHREVEKLSRTMRDGGAGRAKWEGLIREMMSTPQRREEFVSGGLCEPAMVAACTHEELRTGTGAARRVLENGVYIGLLSQAKRQMELSMTGAVRLAPGETGGRYHCVPPQRAVTPGLVSLLGRTDEVVRRNVETLRRERLVVVDDVLDAEWLRKAQAEAASMETSGRMRGENKSPCNPGEVSMEFGLWDVRRRAALQTESPSLFHAVQCMWNLGGELETPLGLALRVPQVFLLASYPPGALYHRHMDSYDGKDIPRLLTVLLYLNWEPREGGQLRAHLPGGPCDIDPLPGRLCVFFAQEVEHEVLPSIGQRHALTLWIWDVKKDDKGR